MAGAQLQPILNRVNSVENYHPFTAETHADWSLEAGDIVTVSREGTQYSSPVHTTTLHWAGKQEMTVESRGEKERGPVSKLAAREYASGGNAYRSGARGGGRRKQLEEDVGEITDSNLWVERDHITAVSGKYEIDKFGNLIIKEGSGLYMNRNNAVFGIFDEGNLTGGIMARKINGQTETLIRGDRVSIGNSNATTVINGKLNTSDLGAEIASLERVNVKSLTSERGGVSVNSVVTTSLTVGGVACDVQNGVRNVRVLHSGNTYTLQKQGFDFQWSNVDGGNFSRATTLSGSWSGGILTVNAAPQGQRITSNIYQGTASWEGNTALVPIMAVNSDRPNVEQNTGRRISVDATARYNAGKSDGQATRPSIATNTSTSPSGATNLGNVLYISSSVQSVVITIGSHRWYARVTK